MCVVGVYTEMSQRLIDLRDIDDERPSDKLWTKKSKGAFADSKRDAEGRIVINDDSEDDDVVVVGPERAVPRGIRSVLSELVQAEDAKVGGRLIDSHFEESIAEWERRKRPKIAGHLRDLLDDNVLVEDSTICQWIHHICEVNPNPDRRIFFAHPGLFAILQGDTLKFAQETSGQLPINLFDHDKKRSFLFVPVCFRIHWVLCVVDLKLYTIEIYDSLRNRKRTFEDDSGKEVMVHDYIAARIRSWVQFRYLAQRFGDSSTTPKFEKKDPRQDVPTQNGIDCGIFVCMYMSYLSSGIDFDFDRDDIPLMRQWIFQCLEYEPDSTMNPAGEHIP